MKLELNALVDHVRKKSERVQRPELFRTGGGTAIEVEAEPRNRRRHRGREDDLSSSSSPCSSSRWEFDGPSLGRIDAAMRGNEESWHLLASRAERGDLKQEYMVQHFRVPIRTQPRVDSSMLCVSRHGDWLGVLHEDKKRSLGWMLQKHPEGGEFLTFLSGSEALPAINQVLASKEATEKVDHENMTMLHFSHPKYFRVILKT